MSTARMSVQDALWLTMDRPNNLMVVDGAMILRGDPDPAGFLQVFTEVVERFPVFGRRPIAQDGGWVWEDVPGFEVSSQAEIVRGAEPMSIGQVQEYLAERRSEPLDKDAPLWRAYLLTPVRLGDGTLGSAVITRLHHAIADGVRLTQVMLGMCDTPEASVGALVARDGAKKATEHAADPVAAVRRTAATVTSGVLKGVGELVDNSAVVLRDPVSAATDAPRRVARAAVAGVQLVGEGFSTLRHPDRALDALEYFGVENVRITNDVSSLTKLALTGSAPTIWTGEVGTRKKVAWSEQMPLDTIKAIGKAAGATVNDVLLSAVAGGLSRYLESRDALVDEVIWMVPVNLKPFEDNLPSELGNYFALVMLPMSLEREEPRERLAQMHKRMARIKNSDEAAITFGVQRLVSMSPSQMSFFLTNFFANKSVGVLTNVPGPRAEISFVGVPVEQVIGFAPSSGNQPMTATIFSYNGGVAVGFATDAGLIPEPDVLADLVVDEVARLGRQVAGLR